MGTIVLGAAMLIGATLAMLATHLAWILWLIG